MSLYPVRKRNSGFTLIEMIVVTVIVGIVAAISAPNFFGLLQRNRITEALSSIEGGLREGQKQAERDGDICTLTISNSSGYNRVSGGCLLETRVLSNNVQLYSNVTTLSFSSKGTASASLTPIVMVVDATNGTNSRKCLVINSLGIIKTGDFTSDPSSASNLDAANCDA